MRIKPFTKQEVEKVYKKIEQTIEEITGIKAEEAEHVEGILIIGFRDDETFSTTNLGQMTLRKVMDACAQICSMLYTENQEEKPKYAT